MDTKANRGLLSLIRKTLNIISGSLAVLSPSAVHASPELETNTTDSHIDNIQGKVLRPKLVLKLNSSNLDESKIVMQHRSHSSHSSHSSHASHYSGSHSSHSSHASHSSHYSSSPSYTPSTTPSYTPSTTPSYTPSSTPSSTPVTTEKKKIIDPIYTPPRKVSSSPSGSNGYPSRLNTIDTSTWYSKNYHPADIKLPVYPLGSRILFKGCTGTDVKELELLLSLKGYDVTVDGYFDEETKTAVIDFQNLHSLVADGKVGTITLARLKK